MESIR